MKSNIKTILKYSLLFIESLLIILIALITTFKFTLFDSNYVKNEFEKENYYKKLTTEIKTEMSYYTEQSGFTDEVLDNIFTENDVQNAFEKYISSLYTGKEFTINTQKIEDNLNKNIDAQLTDKNFKITNAEEITKFVKQMITIYENEIKLMGYVDFAKGIISKVSNMCDQVLYFLIIGLAISTFISIKVFKGKDISVALYTSSFLLLFIIVYIKNSIDINNISIYSELVSNMIKILINNIIKIIGIISCSLLGLGLTIDILRKERRRHHHHHHHRSSNEKV